MSSKIQKRAASESLLFLLFAGGILILLNVLVAYFPSPRVDLTRNGLFSLAEGSERLAGSLDDRLEITAYFTENLPPPFNATERHVRDLLGMPIVGGSSNMQKNNIANRLGLASENAK